MPLGYSKDITGTPVASPIQELGAALGQLTDLWATVGHDTDENQQPVKVPTDEELKRIRELLSEASAAVPKPKPAPKAKKAKAKTKTAKAKAAIPKKAVKPPEKPSASTVISKS